MTRFFPINPFHPETYVLTNGRLGFEVDGFQIRTSGLGGSTGSLLPGLNAGAIAHAPIQTQDLFPCVGEVATTDLMLGSCVILPGGDHALTAAHVVATKYSDLWVGIGPVTAKAAPHLQHAATRGVTAITWQSGESHILGTDVWPQSVERFRYGDDQLAVLHLAPRGAGEPAWPAAQLPGGYRPDQGELLLVAGWGQDAVGNHPTKVWFGTTRARRSTGSWHALHARDPHDLFNGMPWHDDSGGPVFCPPINSPLEGRHLRLVGVHAGRAVAPDASEQLGVYIPIDPMAERWLAKLTTPGSQPGPVTRTGEAETPSDAPEGPEPNDPFRLRGRVSCFAVPDDPTKVFKDGQEFRLVAKGTGELLVNGSRIQASVAGGRVSLILDRKGGKRTIEIIGTGPEQKRYWYIAKEAGITTGQVTYLIMLRSALGAPKVEFRIEGYLGLGRHEVPGIGIVGQPASAQASPNPASQLMIAGGFQQDQDDEGNGYED